MFAIRDQENLVHGHQQLAASKPLNQSTRGGPPKTPGNKYPKTPLKIPLRDENEQNHFGGKSVLGTKGKGLGNNAFVTPMGGQNRAPLGMKTTNAKAKVFQTPAALIQKDLDKTQAKASSTRRAKPKINHVETIKLDIHDDNASPLVDRELEYAPAPVPYPAYESEDFPAGGIDLKLIEGSNLRRGWQKHYLNPRDQNGVSLREKELEEARERSYAETDRQVMKSLEELDWSVSDVPETYHVLRKPRAEVPNNLFNAPQAKKLPPINRGPATIASRKAASTLSLIPNVAPLPARSIKPAAAQKKPSFLTRKAAATPTPVNPSAMRNTANTATSRSTIGYNKGRNASRSLNHVARGLPRSVSNVSHESDTTITPANFADRGKADADDEWRHLKLLSAFDISDEDIEPELTGALPDCLRRDELAEEDFVL